MATSFQSEPYSEIYCEFTSFPSSVFIPGAVYLRIYIRDLAVIHFANLVVSFIIRIDCHALCSSWLDKIPWGSLGAWIRCTHSV